jgi:hypothetical protein
MSSRIEIYSHAFGAADAANPVIHMMGLNANRATFNALGQIQASLNPDPRPIAWASAWVSMSSSPALTYLSKQGYGLTFCALTGHPGYDGLAPLKGEITGPFGALYLPGPITTPFGLGVLVYPFTDVTGDVLRVRVCYA